MLRDVLQELLGLGWGEALQVGDAVGLFGSEGTTHELHNAVQEVFHSGV